MIPHSVTEGFLHAPLKYVAPGFYAVITGTIIHDARGGAGDETLIDHEWVEVKHDQFQWWPHLPDWWQEFLTIKIPDWGYLTASGLRHSYRLPKTRYDKNGEQQSYFTILSPARELNNTPTPIGTIVWMMPSGIPKPTDTGSQDPPTGEDDPYSEIYFFCFSNIGPYPFEFQDDSVPEMYDSNESKVKPAYYATGHFMADYVYPTPWPAWVRAYPASNPSESQMMWETEKKLEDDPDYAVADKMSVATLNEVIRGYTQISAYGHATRGWVAWVQFAFQEDDGNGNMMYFGRWEVVSTNASTEFLAKIVPSGTSEKNTLAPNKRILCELWWYNFTSPAAAPAFEDSGWQIYVDNQTSLTFEEEDKFSIYYDRIANKYFCYALSGTTTQLQWGIVQAGYDNTVGGDVNVVSCDSDGSDPIGDPFDVKVVARANQSVSLFTDYVVGYLIDSAGDKFIVTEVYDDKFGTVKLWDESQGEIPTGWEELITAQGRYIVGVDGTHALDQAGGALTHTHDNHTHTGDNAAVGTARMGTCQLLADHVHAEANHEPPWLGLYYIIRSS